MPATPEPTRLRTPPPPLHGAQHDTFEPYSPRRSTRSTAQRNPYSSKNADRSPRKAHLDRATTPPPTSKRPRFASFSTHLSSPPISPPSANEHRAAAESPPLPAKTPRKALFTSAKSKDHGALGDIDSGSASLATPASAVRNMFPTPVKTPNKRQRTAINPTARILNFQPGHHRANDLMPTPRKIKKTSRTQTEGFELYDDDQELKGQDKIEIFTDTKDRIPTMDGADDNPFVGARPATPPPAPRKVKKKSRDQIQEEEAMDESVRKEEGITYIFRGRKIFRRFTDPDEDADTEVDSNPGQQSLKHQAGSVAQRPLTRSAVRPRLLFPTEEQLRARAEADMVDEEATTDIEMTDSEQVQSSTVNKKTRVEMTPMKYARGGDTKLVTPPPTKTPNKRATRSTRKGVSAEPTSPLPGKLPAVEEDEEETGGEDCDVGGGDETPVPAGEEKKISPFAGWQRTKGSSAGGKKRPAAGDESTRAKKSRSAVVGGLL
ncbi:hypothetical protein MBLNU230_g3343t1 [Neophaeotheca triangularis]